MPHNPSQPKRPHKKRPPHVAVLLETNAGYGRNIIRGLAAYAREHGPWQFLFEAYGNKPDLAQTDGVILRPIPEILAQPHLPPAVIVATSQPVPNIPVIMADQKRTALLASQHFRDLGIEHFAFANDGSPAGQLRKDAYQLDIQHTGGTLHLFPHEIRTGLKPNTWRTTFRQLIRWLTRLPKPVGIFCTGDEAARQVLMACQAANVLVPEEAAILGVDNDDLICELTHPSLSSIDHGAFDVGYTAAGVLHQLMKGERVTENVIRVPPRKLVVRQSTNMLAVKDQRVREALSFIRQNIQSPLLVDDVAQHLALGRRSLELLFRQLLKRSIHAEIIRQRIERVKHLLSETDRPLPWIAQNCGYAHLSNLSSQFKSAVGISPSHYRRKTRRRSSDDPGTSL